MSEQANEMLRRLKELRKEPVEASAGSLFGAAAFALAASVFNAVFAVRVFVDLWVWFVTATWDVPAPSLAAAYGLMLFVALLRMPTTSKDEDAEVKARPWHSALSRAFGRTLLNAAVWGIGYAVHSWWGP